MIYDFTKADYIMELAPHPEGRFFFNNQPYRPEWGKTPEVCEEAVLRKIISAGVAKLEECWNLDFRTPKKIRVIKNSDKEPKAIPIW